MNLKEIRDAMFAQADYSPSSSPEATSRVNGFINRAYNQLALEAPFLFFESKVGLVTEPDTKSKSGLADGSVLDQVALAPTTTMPAGAQYDFWTFRTTYTFAQFITNPTLFTGWDVFRGWDGRMIDLIEDDGTVHRHQIRSVWYDATDGKVGDSHFYFTVVKPTQSYAGTGWDSFIGPLPSDKFKFRIFTDAYPLPDSTIEVKSVRLRDGDNSRPLDVYGQQEAENLVLAGPDSQVASGIPRCIFRRQHAHLKGPSVAPVVAPVYFSAPDNTQVKWLGPEPYGQFEYKVTYTWGKRGLPLTEGGLGHWESQGIPVILNDVSTYPALPTNADLGPSANRGREPRFESPPSPVSIDYQDIAKLSTADDSNPAIAISLPNISYALGFLMSVTVGSTTYTRQSLNQSGVYVRIYRRRKTTVMDKYGTLTNTINAVRFSQIDADDGFYLLAETRVDTTNNGVFIDNGTILPDYNCRLKDVHGYQTFQFYPKPDKSYQTDIRCVTRPQPLVDDSDCPVVHAEAVNVLLEKAMVLFYENLGQPQQSAMSMQKYREELLTLSKRYGDLRPAAVPVLRRMTRAARVRTRRKWNHRLTTDDLGGS